MNIRTRNNNAFFITIIIVMLMIAFVMYLADLLAVYALLMSVIAITFAKTLISEEEDSEEDTKL